MNMPSLPVERGGRAGSEHALTTCREGGGSEHALTTCREGGSEHALTPRWKLDSAC